MKDFYGFQFNGVHSSNLNIVRVSNGSRYEDSTIPDFQDLTAQKIGSDGTLYWESFYNNRVFTIHIAFDGLTEVNYRKFRQVFSANAVGDLIFDELPYKAYTAKVQSPPQLNTICFMEDGERIYKGEGTIQFVCYYPFAKSVHKYLDEFDEEEYTNKLEWADSSGMLEEQGDYDQMPTSLTDPVVTLYNAGDVPTDSYIYLYSPTGVITINLTSNDTTEAISLNFSSVASELNGKYIRINSKTNLIECVGQHTAGDPSSDTVSSKLYNKCLNGGDFFKIPLGESTLATIFGTALINDVCYDYLYY